MGKATLAVDEELDEVEAHLLVPDEGLAGGAEEGRGQVDEPQSGRAEVFLSANFR